MRIALAQLNFHIGNFEQNLEKVSATIKTAKKKKADLLVFAELAVSGYPPRDFLEFNDFLDRCDYMVKTIAALAGDLAVIVGGPSRNPDKKGKPLFNSAFFIQNGKVVHKIHKTLLPTYDVFDEYRYFEPNKTFQTIEFKGRKIALTICEDLWNVGQDNPLYVHCPMDYLKADEPDFIINISASPFSCVQQAERKKVLAANAVAYELPVFYVNHCGAQTELIFDGGSLVVDPSGQVFDEMPYFEECFRVYELNDVLEKKQQTQNRWDKNRLLHDALIFGLKDYFRKLGFKKAILGLSGGIDSAVVAVLAAQALGRENVWGIMMPSRFSSKSSIEDSKLLASNIGIRVDELPIEASFQQMLQTLNPHFAGTPFGLAEENLQARIRGTLLMSLSNKFGHILLNTSNKSELAVGYGTLYGDMCGGLSVIGDVYKTEVYELARYINREAELIPKNILTKPPSAELRPDQKDSDSLPDYEVLDKILFQYIEQRKGPKEIYARGFPKNLVNNILRLVNTNEYKRHQTAPILRVSTKAFGMGRRMPIAAKNLS